MTTIVYKDGVLAADTLLCEGDHLYGYRNKIFELDAWIVGLAGASVLYDEFIKFISGHEYNKEVFKTADLNFAAIVIETASGRVSTYGKELVEENHHTSIKADFIAIGSGAAIAKGALLMGATPKQAVECAAKIDRFTGGEVQVLKLDKFDR